MRKLPFAKPPKRAPRERQHNSTLARPSAPTLQRGGKIKPKRRTASEFARIYHSRARVAWIKAQPCKNCGGGPCENAHTVSGGKGRKADYTTIIPLCSRCHCAYDQYRDGFENPATRAVFKAEAANVERRWQASNNDSASSAKDACGAEFREC